jgi:predicted O-methyltransferase YrrM
VTGLITATDFWARLAPSDTPDLRATLQVLLEEADTRRAKARFNTGSITLATAVALRQLSLWVQPRTVIEVGTFIGASTLALQAEQIYTCDASNDCLPSAPGRETFPYRTSQQMLVTLGAKKVVADLCFLDGLLSLNDAVLLSRVTHAGTVFAFDDYFTGPAVPGVKPSRKGVVNVNLLKGRLPGHVFLEPCLPDTTLALLVPESRL